MMTEGIQLGNPYIIAIAISRLGGDLRPIDLEDLAISAFEIAPTRFCWKKYPDRIDLRIVHYALQSATRLTPPIVHGDMKKGYMLTTEGKEWVEQNNQVELSELDASFRKHSQQDKKVQELTRMRNSTAYEKWQQDDKETISLRDFQEFTRVNEYFPSVLKEQRFLRLSNITTGEEDLEGLLIYLLNEFEGKSI